MYRDHAWYFMGSELSDDRQGDAAVSGFTSSAAESFVGMNLGPCLKE